jgi:hypothetical protein
MRGVARGRSTKSNRRRGPLHPLDVALEEVDQAFRKVLGEEPVHADRGDSLFARRGGRAENSQASCERSSAMGLSAPTTAASIRWNRSPRWAVLARHSSALAWSGSAAMMRVGESCGPDARCETDVRAQVDERTNGAGDAGEGFVVFTPHEEFFEDEPVGAGVADGQRVAVTSEGKSGTAFTLGRLVSKRRSARHTAAGEPLDDHGPAAGSPKLRSQGFHRAAAVFGGCIDSAVAAVLSSVNPSAPASNRGVER